MLRVESLRDAVARQPLLGRGVAEAKGAGRYIEDGSIGERERTRLVYKSGEYELH